MINVYASKLDKEPSEAHDASGVSIQDWLDGEVGYDRRVSPLWSVFLNDKLLQPYCDFDVIISESDRVDIFIEPRDPITATIVVLSVLSAGYAYSQVSKIPDNYSSTVPQGVSIYSANAKANTPKLNGIIPEHFGLHPAYPDLLCAPHRYFYGNKEKVDLMMCVGVGSYARSALRIAETSTDNYGSDIFEAEFGPDEDVSGHSAHENWYTSPEVDRLKLRNAPLDLGAGWTADFSGTEMTVYIDTVLTDFPIINNGIFEITLGTNAGVYIVESVASGVATCWRLLREVGVGGGFVYRRFPDLIWNSFSAATSEAIEWLDVFGGEEWNGYFSCAPDGEVTNKLEFDFNLPRGLATTNSNGDLALREVIAGIEYRDIVLGGDPVAVDLAETTWELSTVDEIGFTVGVEIPATEVSLNGSDISNYTGTYGGAEHVGLKLFGTSDDFIDFAVGHKVTLENFTGDLVDLNGEYYVRGKVDNNILDIALRLVESSYVEIISGATLSGSEVVKRSGIRPEARVKRVTPEASNSSTMDELYLVRIKSMLDSKTSYADITTLAMTITGSSEISAGSQNKINGDWERILPSISSGSVGSAAATSDIAPAVAYAVTNAGYSYDDIDLDSLSDLHDKCVSSGQTFKARFQEDIVLFEAIKRMLACGYAEPTHEMDKMVFVRDEPKETYDYLYTAQKLTGNIKRSSKLYNASDNDGVEVEYFDSTTKTPEKILCVFAAQQGARPVRYRAFGVTDRTQAWRMGMRMTRKLWYSPMSYEVPAREDAFNSSYGSHDAIADNLVDGSFQGVVTDIDVAEVLITLDQDVSFSSGVSYGMAFVRQDGSCSTVFTVTETATDNIVEIDSPIDFDYTLDGSMDAPLFIIGKMSDFFIHTITKKITPSSNNKVLMLCEEYISEIYDDDEGNPDYGPSATYTQFISDLFTPAAPDPLNMHLGSGYTIDKIKRDDYGPSTFGGSDLTEILYSAIYTNNDVRVVGGGASTLVDVNNSFVLSDDETVYSNTTSGLFNGVDTMLQTTIRTEYNIQAAGNLCTVSGWFFRSADNVLKPHVFEIGHNEPNRFNLHINGTVAYLYSEYLDGVQFVTFDGIALNTWYHFEVCVSGNNMYLFIDGDLKGVNAINLPPQGDNQLTVGCFGGEAPTDYWEGYIAEIQVEVGVCRHTSSFTPPSAPLSSFPSTLVNYVRFDGDDGSDELIDSVLGDFALFNLAGIIDFDLSFDSDGYPVVAYETLAGVYVYWRNSGVYEHKLIVAGGSNPFICLSTRSPSEIASASNVVIAEHGATIKTLSSNDDYTAFELVDGLSGSEVIFRAGMVADGSRFAAELYI